MASNVIDGIRLEADLELSAVFCPQLVSVGEGYDSVQQTVRELRTMGFYQFYSELPFMPIVVIGQGSRIKKLGSTKYRRTSDFSAPHRDVFDREGNRAMAINDASRRYAIPKWIKEGGDPELLQWAQDKYQHVPGAPASSPVGQMSGQEPWAQLRATLACPGLRCRSVNCRAPVSGSTGNISRHRIMGGGAGRS